MIMQKNANKFAQDAKICTVMMHNMRKYAKSMQRDKPIRSTLCKLWHQYATYAPATLLMGGTVADPAGP